MSILQKTYDKYKGNPDSGGGDKGTIHDYIKIYSQYITENSCKSLLEIGVYKGHSIKMWEEYLPECDIVGVDVDLSLIEFTFDKAQLIQFDATSKDFLKNIPNKYFDVIIDDGSHKLEDQIKTFQILFPILNKGGHFFIEDVVSGSNEKSLIEFFDKLSVTYKVFRPIEESTRYDDIIFLITK
jgi:SAM-dependent methyltransferase